MITHLVEPDNAAQDVLSSMTTLHMEEELIICSKDWMALSQMLHVHKPNQDTSDMLYTHLANQGQIIPVIQGLG